MHPRRNLEPEELSILTEEARPCALCHSYCQTAGASASGLLAWPVTNNSVACRLQGSKVTLRMSGECPGFRLVYPRLPMDQQREWEEA